MILRLFFFIKQVLIFCALGILLDFEGQIFASIGCVMLNISSCLLLVMKEQWCKYGFSWKSILVRVCGLSEF